MERTPTKDQPEYVDSVRNAARMSETGRTTGPLKSGALKGRDRLFNRLVHHDIGGMHPLGIMHFHPTAEVK